MDYIASQRLHRKADAEWRAVVRAAANQFTLKMRRDPALRMERKRFYRAEIARHVADRRDLLNAFRL
jgi:hypothetical protein